ncbi:MAG: hypothetical protein H6709_04210 [Kofleriaceae bacterium]|nr:hypothetical protein [Myxococcales bacterium]MCB9560164.1 hypothetical protein [Kofleriaceae bacterium]MCB9571275.1 hypothetical protein [Kofleriaceae bacterium]
MADKVAKLSIKRDNDYMYYIKKGDVWRSPRKQAGSTGKGKAEKVSNAGVTLDYAKYIYYLDSDGDIAREARQVGGSKRAKSKAKAKPAKRTAKKAPKKAPAKKVAKKKAPAKKPAKKKAPAKKPAKKTKRR